jgi:hypothetical protein
MEESMLHFHNFANFIMQMRRQFLPTRVKLKVINTELIDHPCRIHTNCIITAMQMINLPNQKMGQSWGNGTNGNLRHGLHEMGV